MFDNSQAAADALKGVILDLSKVDKAARIAALRHIQDLERCGWNRRAFAAAMDEAGIGFDENRFSFKEDTLHSIGRVISIYLESVGCAQGEEDPFAEMYDMQEAAEFLGISYDMMKTYVSRQKRLRGKKVGTGMVFTRRQLEAFKEVMQPAGNPNFKTGE
jgi:hypothetical protein